MDGGDLLTAVRAQQDRQAVGGQYRDRRGRRPRDGRIRLDRLCGPGWPDAGAVNLRKPVGLRRKAANRQESPAVFGDAVRLVPDVRA